MENQRSWSSDQSRDIENPPWDMHACLMEHEDATKEKPKTMRLNAVVKTTEHRWQRGGRRNTTNAA